MATQGELRLCFYFHGRLNYFPDLVPWAYETDYRELHEFRGYLEIPPAIVPKIDSDVSILAVKRYVQSLHEVDGTVEPPATFRHGVAALPGGFTKPKYRKSGEEIVPEAFLVVADDVLVPLSDLDAIVRAAALSKTSAKSEPKQDLSSRERTTYLNIIGAMLELLLNPRPGRDTQGAIISELVENWSDKPGISKSNLEKVFPKAKGKLSE